MSGHAQTSGARRAAPPRSASKAKKLATPIPASCSVENREGRLYSLSRSKKSEWGSRMYATTSSTSTIRRALRYGRRTREPPPRPAAGTAGRGGESIGGRPSPPAAICQSRYQVGRDSQPGGARVGRRHPTGDVRRVFPATQASGGLPP